MVVAEVLTGIALVKKSVDFIKENISTVQDIQGIAKQIDGFFEGEAQMNKKGGKIGLKNNSVLNLQLTILLIGSY